MKKIINILFVCAVTLSCKAQSPIFNITDLENTTKDIYGAYHKDINNLLDPFVGTYIYSTENTTLKIVLQKKIMSSMNGYLYEDLIIGEYQYIENGLEKANTLSKLMIDFSNKRKHSIGGNLIISQASTGCFDCEPNEKALRGGVAENSTHNTAELIIRRITVNGTPAIKIWVMWQMRAKRPSDAPLQDPSFPGGYYTLLKQL